MNSPPGRRRLEPWQAYVVAVASTLAALAVRVAGDEWFRGYPGFAIFAVPVVASAYLGGFRAGLLATAISCVAAYVFPLLPLRPLVIDSDAHLALVFCVAAGGVTISLMGESLHRARERGGRLAGEQARAQVRLVAAQAVGKVGSWETDPATGVVTWSDELYRIFGTSPDAYSPTHEGFLQRVHPEDRERVSRAFDRSLLYGVPCSIEHRIVTADGRVKFVEERWQAFPQEGGAPVRAVGTCQDIDERKLAADALEAMASQTRQREEMLSLMLSTTRDFAFLFDRDGRFIYANQALLDLWGARIEDVIGKDFAELGYPPEMAERLAAQLRQVVDTRCSLTDETLYTWPSGSTGCYEYIFSPAIGVEGTVEHIAGSTRDVTARKQAEEALREAEARYRALFENANDGIFQNTPDGRMLAANPAMARMMGYDSPEEFIRDRTDVGRQTYAQPAERARFTAHLEAHGFIDGFEYEVCRKDGSRIWVSESVRLVRNDAGEAVRYEGSMRDISERKRSETELRRTHKKLVEASRLGGKAEVAAEVLHSVGNVLNSVNVSAGLMADHMKAGRAARMASVVAMLRAHHADIGDYVTRDPAGRHVPQLLEDLAAEWVEQQAVLASELAELRANVDLIKRIVAAQRAHAGAGEVAETVALPELLEDALRVQLGVLAKQHVAVVRDFHPADPVRVPRHKVVQILVSLLRSARHGCKAIDESARRITLRVEPAGDLVSVSVSDNGPGIAADDLARVFEPDFTTRADGRANGLHGAAIAAGELGGSIGVHSQGPGMGTTYTLRLPAQRAVAAA